MASASPSHDADKFMVRFPEGMRTVIKKIARANGRSMNAEIMQRLAASLNTSEEPMATNKTQDDYAKSAIRLPRDLHTMLHQAADAADRTFNAEMLSRLRGSFGGGVGAPAGLAQTATDDLLAELRRRCQ